MAEKMNGQQFRELAMAAVNDVARFLDEFPDLYCEIRVTGKFWTVVVGLEERKPDDEAAHDDDSDV